MRDVVDIDRYDLRDPGLVARARAQFEDEGVCVLAGFVRADALTALVDECDRLAPFGHRSHAESTPYLGLPAPDVDPWDPRATIVESDVVVVAYDLFPADSLLRRLYEDDELLDFVAAVLGHDRLYRYADPFGALNLAVMSEGDALGWHFDFTDFVVSLALQAPRAGGHFENAAKVRSRDDENLAGVASVLAGDAGHLVRTEPMAPGTLMIFNGRWSLHRVTPVEGDVPRYVALLSYDTRPGADSTDLLKLNRYGRLPGAVVKAG